VISATDDAFNEGNPGMGFNYGVEQGNSDFGFTSYEVDYLRRVNTRCRQPTWDDQSLSPTGGLNCPVKGDPFTGTT